MKHQRRRDWRVIEEQEFSHLTSKVQYILAGEATYFTMRTKII